MSLDLQHTTKAVARWREDDTMRFLTKSDPRTRAITFTARFDSENAFFELGVPAKLKGLDIVTNVILRICASSIVSLKLIKNPTLPTAIREEFESTALSLNFTLNRSPTIIVHTGAVEPLSAARKPSGVVLDAVRDLSKATAFSIYIEARDTPTKLQDVSDAASQGFFKSCSTQNHIASMYGGVGGKVIDTSAATASIPSPVAAALLPSYDEAASCPPPHPPIEYPSKKRPHRDTDFERDDMTLLWAEIRAIKEIRSRVDTLETENEKLKQTNKELIEGMDKLQEKHDALETRLVALDDTYDCELTELRQDMDSLEGIIKFVQEGQVNEESLQMIKNVVVEEMSRRLASG